jgi:hypothetical protein
MKAMPLLSVAVLVTTVVGCSRDGQLEAQTEQGLSSAPAGGPQPAEVAAAQSLAAREQLGRSIDDRKNAILVKRASHVPAGEILSDEASVAQMAAQMSGTDSPAAIVHDRPHAPPNVPVPLSQNVVDSYLADMKNYDTSREDQKAALLDLKRRRFGR